MAGIPAMIAALRRQAHCGASCASGGEMSAVVRDAHVQPRFMHKYSYERIKIHPLFRNKKI